MSIQEQPVRYTIPEQTPSSSIVINRGNEEYDPFAVDDDNDDGGGADDDQHESEQLDKIKQESIRINNGTAMHPVIYSTNGSSKSDKSSLLHSTEQDEPRRKSKSPIDHTNHRSKSPSHNDDNNNNNNHYSSDRKRLRPSSPNLFAATTVTNYDSLSNSETISPLKHRTSHRYDDRKRSSKHYHKHSSSSKSPPSTSSSNNHNKKTLDSKDDRFSKSNHRSEKRDDLHSYRSRNHHSYVSSNNDRRTIANANYSSPPRLASKILIPDGNSLLSNTQLNQNESSTEDRNRIYNRLKNVTETNTPNSPLNNNSNKTSSTGSPFINSNGGSQCLRSNLIQIVTTEPTPGTIQIPPLRVVSSQIKSESVKPLAAPSIPSRIESKIIPLDSNPSTKTNGNTADDMLMEEMLLEEEQEQIPVKSIDLDSLTIPDISNKTSDTNEEPIKVIATKLTTTITSTTTTTTTSTTSTVTSVPSLTPSPTKKPYTLYKVPHTNHTTPPLSSRHKKQIKKESSTNQLNSTITIKSTTEDNALRTSLDERISSLLSVPNSSSNKPTNSSTEQQSDVRPNQLTRTSTPSDKSTESPQEIPSLISILIKKGVDHTSLPKKHNTTEDRRSNPSKHYTTEWLASQKPEEAVTTEEIIALPSLVSLPTLISSQPLISNTNPSNVNLAEVSMLGKLSEAMSKLIQKQSDTNTLTTSNEADDAVPISAKHLERLERRKQREKRQTEIAAIAKEALKPAFKKHDITKDEYKEIMKKVVTKATHANEVDRARISKMIDAYIQKYRSTRQHENSKTSNGNHR